MSRTVHVPKVIDCGLILLCFVIGVLLSQEMLSAANTLHALMCPTIILWKYKIRDVSSVSTKKAKKKKGDLLCSPLMTHLVFKIIERRTTSSTFGGMLGRGHSNIPFSNMMSSAKVILFQMFCQASPTVDQQWQVGKSEQFNSTHSSQVIHTCWAFVSFFSLTYKFLGIPELGSSWFFNDVWTRTGNHPLWRATWVPAQDGGMCVMAI